MQISFWESGSFYAHRHVIVVGAGLAGLWSAIEMHKIAPGLKILLLEKGPIPQGASTRNAGFACFGGPTELMGDCLLLGEDKMWQVAEMRYRGISKTVGFFKGVDIGLDPCGGYELLKQDGRLLAEVDEKLPWLNKGMKAITGVEDTFVWNDEKLNLFKFFGFGGLVENKLEAGLHSGKLVQALTQKALGLGIEVMYNAAVTGWQADENGVQVQTHKGQVFTANQLLFCTNGFTSSLVPHMQVTPARGQVLLTAPIKGIGFTGTFHFDEGFYYFRNVGDRVLIGGARNMAIEEETTTELETTDTVQQELERFLREHILPGQHFTVERRWSGIMGFTNNKLPQVTQIQNNVYGLITCNGMGVALAPVMAEKAAAAVLGNNKIF